MLKVISRRINHKDEGFTLIELMVVLVVIGILMAIAIPTFLGAKNTANDRSAQENVRNALTAEQEFFTDNQAYTATAASLSSLEPALSWIATFPTATTGSPVYPVITEVNSSSVYDHVEIQAKSASGGCVYIDQEALAPGAVTGHTLNAGTYYAESSAPCGTLAPAVPTASITAAVETKGTTKAAPKWGRQW